MDRNEALGRKRLPPKATESAISGGKKCRKRKLAKHETKHQKGKFNLLGVPGSLPVGWSRPPQQVWELCSPLSSPGAGGGGHLPLHPVHSQILDPSSCRRHGKPGLTGHSGQLRWALVCQSTRGRAEGSGWHVPPPPLRRSGRRDDVRGSPSRGRGVWGGGSNASWRNSSLSACELVPRVFWRAHTPKKQTQILI